MINSYDGRNDNLKKKQIILKFFTGELTLRDLRRDSQKYCAQFSQDTDNLLNTTEKSVSL